MIYDPSRAADQARMFGYDDPMLEEAWIRSVRERDPDHKIALRVYRKIRDQGGRTREKAVERDQGSEDVSA